MSFSEIARNKLISNTSGRIASVARKMDMTETKLRHRLDGETKFSVEEARRLVEICQDVELADYVLGDSKFMAAPKPEKRAAMGLEVRDGSAHTVIEAADILASVTEALRDGRFDGEDKAKVIEEIEEAERALASLRNAVETII